MKIEYIDGPLAGTFYDNEVDIDKVYPDVIGGNVYLSIVIGRELTMYKMENLRLVCPNCNSQLDTHAGKNRKVRMVE